MPVEPTSKRVPGHTLRSEGIGFVEQTVLGRHYRDATCHEGWGECSCGERSPVLPSNSARKRWHRQHKGDVLAGVTP